MRLLSAWYQGLDLDREKKKPPVDGGGQTRICAFALHEEKESGLGVGDHGVTVNRAVTGINAQSTGHCRANVMNVLLWLGA